ncbi:DUF4488 domain-containing protein [Capnocytophaga canimorsus]|uniref:DUF4488 domain-containing protein n=2 Tax=Capnocytophaga canimorsus TaxID=28188 RepID=F9YVZ3_CAPCC|nr:DUF4488 domain-containing protein [Capnocytophaga canimorsus]AEK24496.1 Hypothetical protein Ccan_23820 [Capnocytophaga canimorsus Cc5]ATA77346.1 DUF4488 domain-containing protein [Capnocytophaga canimorsus]ATA91968.1 DUF4488 domain-containing protein [Capnocytophaga canimorsus]ATA94093.1 DUF4488 domain-containing protein [Capnocytophaga canimorsus]AWL78809.1 DUF4488 domain-containing protein [Capnocytophaga canimorsus]
MKTRLFILFLTLFAFNGVAQNKNIKKHLVESESVVGVWQLVGELRMGEEVKFIPLPNMKIYNEDGTFFLVRMFEKSSFFAITLYGNYEISEDGMIKEYIKGTVLSDPTMVETVSELKYQLEDENNTLSISYKLQKSDKWVSEKWARVLSKINLNKGNIRKEGI